jgi:uncharacterized protein YajQ (UPF0234 family)
VADSSFDVVSKVERQEVDNALNQAAKELAQRFDFRGTNASISWAGEHDVTIVADTEDRVLAALEVFKEKLIKRGISLKALEAGEPQLSGKTYRLASTILDGIASDKAKVIGQEEGRPAGGHRAAQGVRLRDRAAVHQLPLGLG